MAAIIFTLICKSGALVRKPPLLRNYSCQWNALTI